MDRSDPSFLPFTRADQYGELGGQPQPLSERLRQVLFIVFIVPFKVVGTLTCLLSFFTVCKLAWLIPAKYRSDVVALLGKLHCRACLFCLGFISVKWVEVKEEGGSGGSRHRQGATPPAQAGPATPPGIVSNHTSWADIPLHMSRYFPAFVARDKTKATPLIGIIR